ncbi:hypothetical protein JTB14_036109 [Gonioctena quinquepunctata]|nr:hypothetical protein JTB14_036109 [Gonioctena quinquepunctata]
MEPIYYLSVDSNKHMKLFSSHLSFEGKYRLCKFLILNVLCIQVTIGTFHFLIESQRILKEIPEELQ